ncbi:hypothetical protein SDC9_83907 [bioreactor metagenome]|uniref:Uncharacterized protein n=1 Tax=bioreactor metagenome TaxID=1076179 RepID=A0A644ZAI1_9ZZZZ
MLIAVVIKKRQGQFFAEIIKHCLYFYSIVFQNQRAGSVVPNPDIIDISSRMQYYIVFDSTFIRVKNNVNIRIHVLICNAVERTYIPYVFAFIQKIIVHCISFISGNQRAVFRCAHKFNIDSLRLHPKRSVNAVLCILIAFESRFIVGVFFGKDTNNAVLFEIHRIVILRIHVFHFGMKILLNIHHLPFVGNECKLVLSSIPSFFTFFSNAYNTAICALLRKAVLRTERNQTVKND